MRNEGHHRLPSVGVPHSQPKPSGPSGQHYPLETPLSLAPWLVGWPLSLSSILTQKQLEMEQKQLLRLRRRVPQAILKEHQVFPLPFLMPKSAHQGSTVVVRAYSTVMTLGRWPHA